MELDPIKRALQVEVGRPVFGPSQALLVEGGDDVAPQRGPAIAGGFDAAVSKNSADIKKVSRSGTWEVITNGFKCTSSSAEVVVTYKDGTTQDTAWARGHGVTIGVRHLESNP
jgi:hypothetical protein